MLQRVTRPAAAPALIQALRQATRPRAYEQQGASPVVCKGAQTLPNASTSLPQWARHNPGWFSFAPRSGKECPCSGLENKGSGIRDNRMHDRISYCRARSTFPAPVAQSTGLPSHPIRQWEGKSDRFFVHGPCREFSRLLPQQFVRFCSEFYPVFGRSRNNSKN